MLYFSDSNRSSFFFYLKLSAKNIVRHRCLKYSYCFPTFPSKFDCELSNAHPWVWAMLVAVIKDFGRQTSLKGIPRLLRTKSVFMRATWAMSILCFLAMAISQAAILTMTFLERSSVSAIHEMPIDPDTPQLESRVMPEVTFCNINPFSSNFTNASDIMTIEEFHQRVTQMTSCTNCTEEDKESMAALRGELLTTRGYYMQIGKTNALRISHQTRTLIAACHVLVTSGTHPSTIPCESNILIKSYTSPSLYSCFSFRSLSGLSVRDYRGIILVFHLDDYGINNYPLSLPSISNLGYAAGIVFSIHHKDLVPIVEKENTLIPVGVYSNTKIRLVKRSRLAKPYGICVKNVAANNKYHTDTPYSKSTCYTVCQQTRILDICGCVDGNIYLDDFNTTGKRHCLKLDLGMDQLINDWNCLQTTRNVSALNCTDACPLPCEEIKYETQVCI